VHLSSELSGLRAEKRPANRAQRELRIEAAFRVEADLAGEDRAVMKPTSRHQGGGVEP